MDQPKKLIYSTLSKGLRRINHVANTVRRQINKTTLPEGRLEEKHVRNCQITLNRRAMLQRIGKLEVVAELGVNRGEFSREILDVMQPSRLHLVDIWDSERYHDGLFHEVTSKLATELESGSVQVHRKLSTEAHEDFPDEYFDMVYIDTDHSYQTTRDELMAYASKMKPDGILAGHDYSMGNWDASCRYGVFEAVHEFCVTFDWELCFLTAEPLESPSFAIRKIT